MSTQIDPGPEGLIIMGSGAKRFAYAKVMVSVGCVLALLFIPLVARRNGLPWLVLVGIPLGLGMESLGICWMWIRRQLRVSYVMDQDELRALRGGRIVKTIQMKEIRSVKFSGRMSYGEFFTSYQPSWPSLIITCQVDGKKKVRFFPEIMLWDTEMNRAEEALRRRLGQIQNEEPSA